MIIKFLCLLSTQTIFSRNHISFIEISQVFLNVGESKSSKTYVEGVDFLHHLIEKLNKKFWVLYYFVCI